LSCNIIKYSEHKNDLLTQEESALLLGNYYTFIFPKKRGDMPSYTIIKQTDGSYKLEATYFIGLDWLDKPNTAIYIEPKLNIKNEQEVEKSYEIDFIKMLFSSLRHPEISKEIKELFFVKWDETPIEIEQKQDLLTPFLVVEFLSILKVIVRKGLKKSYYKIEQNLNSKVKGKVVVGKTIKQNLMKNKSLFTYCSFEEFGLNNKENRLLKKTLVFVKRYLPNYIQSSKSIELQNTFNYISPAFETVSDEIELNEIKQSHTNALYKEYEEAIRIAKLILQRFGYNISNTNQKVIKTPPFWIDMSKLFELYALGILRDKFYNDVIYQFIADGSNELDFVLNTKEYQMVIDAKYRSRYIYGKHEEDIRQVSGYARLKSVYKELNKIQGDIIDCLIIYPDQVNGLEKIENTNLKGTEIRQYFDVYKIGIKLPVIK
jgi:5-methylcytosine-specific restriction enzyme subunit McrC